MYISLNKNILLFQITVFTHFVFSTSINSQSLTTLKAGFDKPPNSAKPGVYWYFMNGNITKESMTADLESMKKAGIGNLVFLEVDVGIPKGPIAYFSEKWHDLFVHAVRESERLGIEISLGIGPGWNGSGGPWVKPEESMQQLVASSVIVEAAENKKIILPVPEPKKPYFSVPAELEKAWRAFYEDVAVLAYPSPAIIKDPEDKALYYRGPYSSRADIKPYFPATSIYAGITTSIIPKDQVIDLTGKMNRDGLLSWTPPPGKWTVSRFGRRNNGASTRPAPAGGLGFECDKFDTAALNNHLEHFIGLLLQKTGIPDRNSAGGLKKLHIDSWEVGAQNWTPRLREEFIIRRGYDPLPFYPVYLGTIVESLEISERFLWDLRQTAMELVLEYHAGQVKKYAHRFGMDLSIEPYDMNPTADLELGSVADVPMGEFWSKGFGFNSSFSCIEAASIAHVNGKSLVPAEAFTAQKEGWQQYPGSMKNQGDWAFATGINRFVYHTFQNQFLPDSLRPGATMGMYSVHWDRSQTWWPMVDSYHQYVSRCGYILQQGTTVADVLYLTPEGAPHVFRAPSSAVLGDTLPDRKGFNFDGCSPGQLYKANVTDGQVTFAGGAKYRLLVLPVIKTMTPGLLEKIIALVNDGATVVGGPPQKSPSLSGFPQCDDTITSLVNVLWGGTKSPEQQTIANYGKGKVIWGGELDTKIDNLYPDYFLTADILKSMNLEPDFSSDGAIRYTHRTSANWDVYFVSNATDKKIDVNAFFRCTKGTPQLWDPLSGEIEVLNSSVVKKQLTYIPMQFDAYQSFFIVFAKGGAAAKNNTINHRKSVLTTLKGPWNISFDPKWGGVKAIQFDQLEDWTSRPEDGIKYYSGIAVYSKPFDLPDGVKPGNHKYFLDLGEVKSLARIKLNGKDLGAVWTAPWRVDISSVVLPQGNKLEIEVANLWINRLIGDEKLPDDGIKDGKWPGWLILGKPRTSGRYTFTTERNYTDDSKLLPSGLIGPVTVQTSPIDHAR